MTPPSDQPPWPTPDSPPEPHAGNFDRLDDAILAYEARADEAQAYEVRNDQLLEGGNRGDGFDGGDSDDVAPDVVPDGAPDVAPDCAVVGADALGRDDGAECRAAPDDPDADPDAGPDADPARERDQRPDREFDLGAGAAASCAPRGGAETLIASGRGRPSERHIDPRIAAQQARILLVGRILVVVVLVGFAAAFGRVVQLKVAPEEPLRPYLRPPTSTMREIGRRGDILDARGRVVATSTLGWRLFIDPGVVEDLDATAAALAPCLKLHPQEILQQIAARPGSRYILLSRLLEDWQVDAIRSKQASRETGRALRGVGLEPRLVRHTPHGAIGAALVGFVGIDHDGLGGVEHQFDAHLSPEPGSLVYQRDAMGRVLFFDEDGYRPKVDGNSLHLTVDLVVQQFVEERLDEVAREFNARGARAIVLDVRSGDILAVADVLRERRRFREIIPGDLRERHPAWGRPRAASDPYEPGSIFKPFVWALALDAGRIRRSEVLPLTSGLYRTSRGRAIRDVKSYGPVTAERVLIKSLNSGMALIGERMTPRELRDGVLRFGFGQATRCGLPAESSGRVTPQRSWGHYSQTSVPMGQEISATMLQLAQAFSAFCRDGTMVQPRLVAGRSAAELIERRVVSPETARTVREILLDVVGPEGTARHSRSDRYRIFGKTGTPQLAVPAGREREFGVRGYFQDRYIPGFLGGAPFDDPRIAVVVAVDDPDRSKGHFGGVVAAPVARDIIDFTLAYLGVEPDVPAADQGERTSRIARSR
ncbi:MAG TPA: penicillin-binding protein 2 [Phycisphaerales bacterium]|nr:penicillin-binding protein 2 [Phycisphaerales bacterium]HMP36120.1 penicillin-binding protein 2 [Phycisphaerales bacterium]